MKLKWYGGILILIIVISIILIIISNTRARNSYEVPEELINSEQPFDAQIPQ